MIRFLWVIGRSKPHPSPGHALGGLAWVALVILVLLLSLLLGTADAWATNALPTAAAIALALPFVLVAWRKPGLLRRAVDRVPPGDLLGLARPLVVILRFVLRTVGRWWSRLVRAGATGIETAVATVGPPPADPERGLRRWQSAGAAWLVITSLLLALSFWTLSIQLPVSAETPSQQEAPFEPPPASETDARPGAAPLPPPSSGAPPIGTRPHLAEEAPEPFAESKTPKTPSAVSEAEQAVPKEPVPSLPPAGESMPPSLRSKPEPDDKTVPPEPPSEHRSSDAQKPAVEAPEPAPAEPSTPSGDAVSPPRTGVEAGVCDPQQRFLFTHPAVPSPLRLKDCASGPDGPTRLLAPPLSNRLVEMVQRHLRDLGFDPGPVDGLIGPRTREAIRRFERDQGERATGTISFSLLERIRFAASN
jgi:hypothetical protein